MAATWLWTTAFLLNAGFILLSGSEAGRRCYWCGPLAEQVHRSRRSAPCGASDHVTVCEPGYNYCAVVATSPPRVESRYCVKMYQDECYPLYCNSTKTWKMTCPCRGDLCNGVNTERETEAFALLPKLVAKTHNARIKKRTANAAPHLIKHDAKRILNDDAEIHNISSPSSNNDNKLIVTENDGIANMGDESRQLSENMQSDQPTNIIVEHHNEENNAQSTAANRDNMQATATLNNQLIEIEILVSDPTVQSNTVKENEQPCTDTPTTTEPEETKNTEPLKNEAEPMATPTQSDSKIESSMKPTEINVAESETTKTTEVVPQITTETKGSDKPHSEPNPSDKPPTEIMPNYQSVDPLDQMQNDAPMSPTEIVQSLKTTEEIKYDEASTKDIVKTSGIPTAESLQQNGSPSVSAPVPVPVTEKPTDPTTIETVTTPTILTTQEQIRNMTTTSPQRKNNAVQLSFRYALLITICLVYL